MMHISCYEMGVLLGVALILQLVAVLCQAQTDPAAVLLAIKAAVGASSSDLTSWNGTSPCIDRWKGVTCDAYNNVIQLNISSFNLIGELPSEITTLTSLQSLDVSKNGITGSLPSGFEQLTEMRWLNISANTFNGQFPQALLDLKNLLELRIDNNNFTGAIPEEISKLENIEQLWMGNNTFVGALPKSMSSLVHLNTLTIWGANLNGMALSPSWDVWINLTYLNLHNTYITGPLPLEWGAKFIKLQRLILNGNSLTGTIPDTWQSMKSLQQLKLEDNMLTGLIPSWVALLQQHNATVNFQCNYLTGPNPTSFNSSTWSGNCFSDLRAHSQKCTGYSCTDFLAKLKGESSKSISKATMIGIVIGAAVFCIILVGTAWKFKKFFMSKRLSKWDEDGDWEVPQGVRRFTSKEISKATKTFSKTCEIGEGGFGKVYLAQLEDGRCLAIKRAIAQSFQGTKEFRNEITLLSRLHHRHLVRLEGFCDDKGEQILVYEYMKNGNLHHHLFDKDASTLNWYRRLEIALGVAQGLDYLHTFADPPVIHRDVKPSNILLDENMIAKVSDFGISKINPEMDTHVSTRPAGTAGYLDPEYFLRRQLTTASDVYGYGVVLLELLTGQISIDHMRFEDYNLVGWVRPKFHRKGIQAIIDPRIGPNYPTEAYTQVADLAIKCTSFERGQRPSMQAIVSTLELVLSTLNPPREHTIPLNEVFSPQYQGNSSQGSTSLDIRSEGKTNYSFNETLEPR